MKPTRARRYLTRSPSPRSTRLEPSTSMRPAVGRSIPPRRFSRVVFPHPEGPWTATGSPSPTCMSSPRSAMTSDFPARYTLIRSFVVMLGTSPSPELQDLREVHVRRAHGDEESGEEHRRGSEEDEQEGVQREHEEIRYRRGGDAARSRGEPLGRDERCPGTEADPDCETDEDDHERLSDEELRRLPAARAAGDDRREFDVPFEARGVEDEADAGGQDDDDEGDFHPDEPGE